MTIFTSSLISTTRELREFLSSIPPRSTLYVDLEGDNVCRHGTVSLITILIHQLQEIHIIDVLTLGYAAFTTVSDSGETLKAILEDPSITKCFWDVRNDADALWALYEVDLVGVMDIQLLENASRQTGRDKEYLAGRDMAISNDLNPGVGIMNVGRDPRPGSFWMPFQRYVVEGDDIQDFPPILRRPLDKDTVLKCTRDVLHLRGLRDVYMKRISIAWLGKVRQESAKRIAEAHAGDYVPKSPLEAKGPWKARIGTVGITPVMLDRKLPAYDEREVMRVPNLDVMKGTERKVEKKRSRLGLHWKSVSSYRASKASALEAASGDWWD